MEKKSKNITVTVTPSTYTRARVWAAERNTSLSTVVAAFLEDLPNLRSLRSFSKADLPRKVKAPRKAYLYVHVDRSDSPAPESHSAQSNIPCVPVSAPRATPSASPDAAGAQ